MRQADGQAQHGYVIEVVADLAHHLAGPGVAVVAILPQKLGEFRHVLREAEKRDQGIFARDSLPRFTVEPDACFADEEMLFSIVSERFSGARSGCDVSALGSCASKWSWLLDDFREDSSRGTTWRLDVQQRSQRGRYVIH
jgi:hypothetical protein